MLTYLVYAIRRFAGASWFLTAAAMAVFIGAMAAAFNVHCWEGRMGFSLENVPVGARAQCMNGSLGYGPAFAAMLIIGCWLALKRHKAATLMLAATAAFAVSLTLRSLDQQLCGEWIVMGHRMGTHFLWHLFNSLTLFLLLMAAIRHGGGQEVLSPRPKAKPPVYAISWRPRNVRYEIRLIASAPVTRKPLASSRIMPPAFAACQCIGPEPWRPESSA